MPKCGYVAIARDPFARGDVVRATLHTAVTHTCDWCGQPGRPIKRGGHRLFIYGWESDDRPGRAAFARGMFCSVGCYRSYHS